MTQLNLTLYFYCKVQTYSSFTEAHNDKKIDKRAMLEFISTRNIQEKNRQNKASKSKAQEEIANNANTRKEEEDTCKERMRLISNTDS